MYITLNGAVIPPSVSNMMTTNKTELNAILIIIFVKRFDVIFHIRSSFVINGVMLPKTKKKSQYRLSSNPGKTYFLPIIYIIDNI